MACWRINQDIETSKQFCLNVNVAKSNVLLFGTRAACVKLHKDITIRVGHEILQLTSSAKNLGLIIDLDLCYIFSSNIVRRAYCN